MDGKNHERDCSPLPTQVLHRTSANLWTGEFESQPGALSLLKHPLNLFVACRQPREYR